ncbi:MAG: hydrolase, partial [Bacteroidota bacterium]
VNFHWSGLENFAYFNPDASVNQWYTRLRHFIFFKNTSQLRFRLNNNFVSLLFPFGLTEVPLPVGDYNMTEFNVQFNTDTRKKLNTEWFVVYGQFYNGNKLTYRGSLSYRAQPWGNFTIGIEQNDIWLPEPYGNVNFTLLTGRVEINFATNLFWTTFVQYNTQANNFNINSRFQWRFAPMSDLFVVYTDNYLISDIFGPKNRSLVVKASYWLGL